MNKKYQVFISSTYEDLKAERKAVEETIIRSGDIPVGMEAFPAADEVQFEFIKTVIDSCDYYVLIIGGRYGSLASEGISFTEKEYHYAVSKNIPVLVFPHGDPESIPVLKSEKSAESAKLLQAFIEKASSGRLRKTWTTIDGLKLAIRESLDYAKATKPRPGWVRGDSIASIETLMEIESLRKANSELKEQIQRETPDLGFEPAGLDTVYDIRGTKTQPVRTEYGDVYGAPSVWSTKESLKKIFSFVGPNMRGDLIHSALNNRIGIAVQTGPESSLFEPEYIKVDADDFNSILLQLEALGLIETSRTKTAAKNNADYSRLTAKGINYLMRLRVKSQPA